MNNTKDTWCPSSNPIAALSRLLNKSLEAHEADQNTLSIKGCRDMTKCFTNGQRIRHIIGINKTLIGTYDSSKNGITNNRKTYYSLSEMAKAHNKMELPFRHSHNANGWKECECEVDGKWISTYLLPC
jgi:hypothetical protein